MEPDIIVILIRGSFRRVLVVTIVVLHWVLAAQEIHHVSLLTKVNSYELPTGDLG